MIARYKCADQGEDKIANYVYCFDRSISKMSGRAYISLLLMLNVFSFVHLACSFITQIYLRALKSDSINLPDTYLSNEA